MFPFANPALIGPLLSLGGLVAKEAGKPGLAAVVADPDAVSDVVAIVDALSTVVSKGIALFGRLKATLA